MKLGSEKEILEELDFCLKCLNEEKERDVRFALYNYIQNLLRVLREIGSNYTMRKSDIFKDLKMYQKFQKQEKLYKKMFNDNFCFYKDFFADYLNDILVRTEPLFYKYIEDNEYSLENDELSEKEFLDIFCDFCNKLGIGYLFDNVVDGKILSFDRKITDGNYLGLMIHNPLNGKSHILVDDFSYNIDSMFTLAHEMGHVYDVSFFDSKLNISKYNDYMYKSLKVEVLSKLFEKLLLDYLIDNNIKKNVVIDKLIDSFIVEHDYIYSLYVLSLLDDRYIDSDRYLDISKDRLFDLVSKYFEDKKEVYDTIKNNDFLLIDNAVYAYGEIISLFLEDDVRDCSLSNSFLFNKFMDERFLEFSDNFMETNGFSPSKYQELYEKRLKLIKK
mgnify:FL=1